MIKPVDITVKTEQDKDNGTWSVFGGFKVTGGVSLSPCEVLKNRDSLEQAKLLVRRKVLRCLYGDVISALLPIIQDISREDDTGALRQVIDQLNKLVDRLEGKDKGAIEPPVDGQDSATGQQEGAGGVPVTGAAE